MSLQTPPPRLEPMTAGMILDYTLRLYGRNAPLFIGIVAIAFVPYYLSQVAVIFAADLALSAARFEFIVGFAAPVIGSLIQLLVLTPLSTGAMLFAISGKYLSEDVTLRGTYRRALKRFPSLFAAYIIVGLIVVAALVAALICSGAFFLLVLGVATLVGLSLGAGGTIIFLSMVAGMGALAIFFVIVCYIYLVFSMAIPIVVVENGDPITAIRRSRELTRGFLRKIFAVLLVYYLLYFVAALAVFGLLALFTDVESAQAQIGLQIAELIVALLAAPPISVALMLLYYDLRIRKEGFDLDVLSQSLGGAATVQSTE